MAKDKSEATPEEFTPADYEAAARILYPELVDHKFNGSEIVAKNAKTQPVFIHQDILAREMRKPAPTRA